MKDFVADLVTKIKNGKKSKLQYVDLDRHIPSICIKILEILEDEGYILGFKFLDIGETKTNEKKEIIRVLLKYDFNGESIIQNIYKISSSKKRIYISTETLWKSNHTIGGFIISTSKGVLFDRDARFLNVGGELLLGIY